MDKLLDEKNKSRRNKPNESFLKEKFAKEMNCTVSLLNNLDSLIKIVFKENTDESLIANTDCCYCGRCNNEKNIWIGMFFEKPIGHKLAVGFCVYEPNQKKEKFPKEKYIAIDKLLVAHYKYFAEYVELDGGYWFYVFVDYSLESCCSILEASIEIDKIIKEVEGK